MPTSGAALGAALAALTAPELAGMVDLVAYPQTDPQHGGSGPVAVVVANSAGAVRLHPDDRHELLAGADPVACTDPLAFLPYPLELADPSPDNARNAYPDPARRLLSFFADPGRSPDLAVVHTPRHYFPAEGGHRGEHGSLDVIQSRAPFLLSGAGVARAGVLAGHARVPDVMPTLLLAGGVPAERHHDALGRPLDGAARADLFTGPAGRYLIGLLWDGAHCSDLLHLAGTGELPAVARLLEGGVALAGGAVAEFPSVTLCNHTSALTGVGPGRHGILGNVFYDRDTQRAVNANDATTWHRSAEWLRPGVLTVFEALAAARPGVRTACVNEPVDRGSSFSTMQLIRDSGAADGAAALDSALPAVDGSRFVGDRAHLADGYFRWASQVDDLGVQLMLNLYADAATAPTLSWWSHVITDAGQHAGGPRSPIARDSLRDADRRLQALLDRLDRLGIADEVTFLLTADHGFESADPGVTGSWRPALAAALDPLGVGWRDEGPGLVYLDT